MCAVKLSQNTPNYHNKKHFGITTPQICISKIYSIIIYLISKCVDSKWYTQYFLMPPGFMAVIYFGNEGENLENLRTMIGAYSSLHITLIK